jgi:hypothetical protein
MNKVSIFLIFISLSTPLHSECTDRISHIDLLSGEISAVYDSGRQVTAKLDIEPNYLDYSYKILDLNQDAQDELIIIEHNDVNSSVIVLNDNNHTLSIIGYFTDIRYSNSETCLFTKNNERIKIKTIFNKNETEVFFDDLNYNDILNHCLKMNSIFN